MTFLGCRQCPVKRQAEDAEESNLAGKCVCVEGGGGGRGKGEEKKSRTKEDYKVQEP